MDINLPPVLAEVEAAFARYETALVTNHIATLQMQTWVRTPEGWRVAAAPVSLIGKAG